MQGYKIPFKENPRQDFPPNEPKWTTEELPKIRAELGKLLSKQAVEECNESKGQFISSYFLVPKPDGSNRFIINLKNLNKFINPPFLHQDGGYTLYKNFNKSRKLYGIIRFKGSILLGSPVHKESRKYLRFRFQNKLLQFTCLPFGLCTSPYVYTKIMKPVMNKLRSLGMLSVIYIDDLLFIKNSSVQCSNDVQVAIKLLEHLGFVINYKKSSLVPRQRYKYLGFIINSIDYTLELTNKKKSQIVNLCKSFEEGKYYKSRDVAKLLGVLTAAVPAVAYGSIHTKRLERQKFLALIINNNNYESKMIINESMKNDLDWWQYKAVRGKNPIRLNQFLLELSSDASLTGWGAHCQGISAHGFWSTEERQFSINYLELLAAFFALKCFATDYSNCEILLRIDNTSAIAYINRAGGVQFPHLSELSRKIWKWCEDRNIWIFASYIPSKENIEADYASRIVNVDAEWELNDKIFKKILKHFGPFSIDLFASRLNKKCKRFCSRFPNPGVTAVDAFTISWKNEDFYAFPPFAIISRTLRKIISDKAKDVVVIPMWPTQHWYPLFM